MTQEDGGDVAGAAAAKKEDDVEDMFASEVEGGDGEDVLGPLKSVESSRARSSFALPISLSRSIAVVSGSAKSHEGRDLEGSLTDSALQQEQAERSFVRASRSASLPPQRLARQAGGDNQSHLALLVRARQQSTRILKSEMGDGAKLLAGFAGESLSTVDESISEMPEEDEEEKDEMKKVTEYLKNALRTAEAVSPYIPPGGLQRSIDIRMKNFTYTVPVNMGQQRIQTVGNLGCIFKLYATTREIRRAGSFDAARAAKAKQRTSRHILKDINLCLQAGKLYLVLGPPSSGKTSLLKAIASLLPDAKCVDSGEDADPTKEATMSGSITYNGLGIDNAEGVIFENAIAYIDQIDRHAPRLTVKETFDFSYQCKGGTHFLPGMIESPGLQEVIAKLDAENHRVSQNLLGVSILGSILGACALD